MCAARGVSKSVRFHDEVARTGNGAAAAAAGRGNHIGHGGGGAAAAAVATPPTPSNTLCTKRVRMEEINKVELTYSTELAEARRNRADSLTRLMRAEPNDYAWRADASAASARIKRVVYAPCPNQFAFTGARNACTSIALVTAYNFLRAPCKSVVSRAMAPFDPASPLVDFYYAMMVHGAEAMKWTQIYRAGAKLYTDSQQSSAVAGKRQGPRGVRTTLQHAFEVFFQTDGEDCKRMQSEMRVAEEMAGSLDPTVYARTFGYTEAEAASHCFMTLRTAVDRMYAASAGGTRRVAAVISVRGSSACVLLEACSESAAATAPVAWFADSHGGAGAHSECAVLVALRDRDTLMAELQNRYPPVDTRIVLEPHRAGVAPTVYDADLFDPSNPLNAFDMTVFVSCAPSSSHTDGNSNGNSNSNGNGSGSAHGGSSKNNSNSVDSSLSSSLSSNSASIAPY